MDALEFIKNSTTSEEMKAVMSAFLVELPETEHCSARSDDSSPEFIWHVDPLSTQFMDAYVTLQFEHDEMCIYHERFHMHHPEYEDTYDHELLYADPQCTPEHVRELVLALIAREERILLEYADRQKNSDQKGEEQ